MSTEMERLEALAERLRTVPAVAPAGAARERGWNLVRAQVRYAPKPARRTALLNWRPGIALAFALVLVVIGTLGVAASSLPDSPLYPVKSFEESVQGFVAFLPVDQFNYHLSLARKRQAEAQAMFATGHTDLGIRMLGALDDQLAEAAAVVQSVRSADPRLGEQMDQALTAAVDTHTRLLAGLQGRVSNARALNAIANAEDDAQRVLQVASAPSATPSASEKAHPSPKASGNGGRANGGNEPSAGPSGTSPSTHP